MRRIYGLIFVGACALVGAAIPFAARDPAPASAPHRDIDRVAHETRHETSESLQIDMRPLEVLPEEDGERVTLLLVITGNSAVGASATLLYDVVDEAGNIVVVSAPTSIQFAKGRVSFTQWRALSSRLGDGRYEARARVASVPALAPSAEGGDAPIEGEAHASARLPFRVTGDKITWDETLRY